MSLFSMPANEIGASIQIFTCNGGDGQIWSVSQDGTFHPKSEQNLCLDIGSNASCAEAPWNTYPYCDSSKDAETRTQDLLNRLILIDKV